AQTEEAARNGMVAGRMFAAGARKESIPKETTRTADELVRLDRASVVEIATPEPSIRWRIAGGRVVQRSTDAGTNWDTESTGVTSELTAGAAPSSSICWLVGRAAVVLLSTDGHAWRRVQFPVAVDLIAVRAVDERTASVTTIDGRIFTTRDGGETW